MYTVSIKLEFITPGRDIFEMSNVYTQRLIPTNRIYYVYIYEFPSLIIITILFIYRYAFRNEQHEKSKNFVYTKYKMGISMDDCSKTDVHEKLLITIYIVFSFIGLNVVIFYLNPRIIEILNLYYFQQIALFGIDEIWDMDKSENNIIETATYL